MKALCYNYPEYLVCLYFQIGRSFHNIKDYDAAISYFEKVKYHAKPWDWYQKNAVTFIAIIWAKGKENVNRSTFVQDKYIEEYLDFMEISATDCWDKCYRDDFLAELYHNRSIFGTSYDIQKFLIIAAAWGHDKAKESCKDLNLDYSSKPYKYEY